MPFLSSRAVETGHRFGEAACETETDGEAGFDIEIGFVLGLVLSIGFPLAIVNTPASSSGTP